MVETKTPGQIVYEAYLRHWNIPGLRTWHEEPRGQQRAWEDAAQAVWATAQQENSMTTRTTMSSTRASGGRVSHLAVTLRAAQTRPRRAPGGKRYADRGGRQAR